MAIDYDLDMSAQIDALPKHAGYTRLPPRSGERYVTLHYSGINYTPTDHAGELQRILAEARYQLDHDYGDKSYPDGLLYDVVILSDGTRVKTRAKPVQLWHCGNQIGNRLSWAIHVMLGPSQEPTTLQWQATVNVIEQLCVAGNIPRPNVVGHCEWPRVTGLPQPTNVYKLLPSQSECPGKFLHARLAAWRAIPLPPEPLRSRSLPGATGPVFCSARAADHYAARGGLGVCGYPTRDEFASVGQNGVACTILRCERVLIKDGREFALLGEARSMGWLG